jgi:hypothetical protein
MRNCQYPILNQRIFNQKLKSILLITILVCAGLLIFITGNIGRNDIVEGSAWIQTSDSDFDKGTYNNTTVWGTGENARLRIDISELNQWNDKKPTGTPMNRYCAGMAAIHGTDKVVLYGGAYVSGSLKYLNDTWIYDTKNNTWTQKFHSTNPSARYGHMMATIWGTDKVLFYAGYPSYEDTWIYDLSSDTWTQLFPQNDPGIKGFGAMASVWGTDKVVLFGSWTNSDETWIYDFSKNNWTQRSISTRPSGRSGQAMASVYNDDRVLLFGGYAGSSSLNDTWVYDLSADKWTEHKPTVAPSPRYYAGMAQAYGTNRMILFGGFSTTVYSDETWIYDLSDKSWEQKTLLIKPQARYCHSVTGIYGTDKILMFGGANGFSGGNFFNDTWIYKYYLQTKNGTYISTPFDTGANSTFMKIRWNATTPSNTILRIQLRTATNRSDLRGKVFLGPDGTISNYYTSSPTNIWSGHYGDRWIQYAVYLNMSIIVDTPSLKDITINYNCLPKTKVIGPVNGSVLAYNKPIFLWTFDDFDSKKQKAFQLIIDDDLTFLDNEFNSGIQYESDQLWEFPKGTDYTILPEGIWYWKVRTLDMSDLWTEFSSPRKLIIDTHTPSSAVTFPANDGFYSNLPTISGISHDTAPSSGMKQIELAIKRLTDNHHWNGSTWIQLNTWVTASGSINWAYDSINIEWTSGIMYSVQSRAIDNASNTELSNMGNIFTIDKDKPQSFIDYPKNNDWLNNVNVIHGTSADPNGGSVVDIEICIMCCHNYDKLDSGPKVNQYWDGTAWVNKEIWLTPTGTQQWSISADMISWITGDHYLIRSRAYDIPGNAEIPSKGITFMYDSKPPENLEIYINNGDEYTSSSSATMLLQAEDIGSGIAEMAFSTNGLLWSEWETYNTSYELILPSGDGEKIIYYKTRDYTGNVAEAVSDTIILDTTPPQELAIEIMEEGRFTNSRRLGLNLKATDIGSGVSEMAFSFDAVFWEPWETFTNTRYIDYPVEEGDGKKHVYYKVRDKLGNAAEPVFDSIIIDTDPPYSLSISINNGAPETNSTSVTIDIDALDKTSGVSEISFSIDGEIWSSWEPFNTKRSFTLPPVDGEKTVYFRAKDKVGNVAEPVHSTIYLNSTIQIEDVDTTKTPSSTADSDFWLIIIVVVIIAVVLVVIGLSIVIIRKKRDEQEQITVDALTIKPRGLPAPETTFGQIPSAPSPTPLARAPTPVPMLAKTTQIGQPQVTPTVAPQPIPQLPPAQIRKQEPQSQISTATTPTVITPTPTLAETPIETPQSTVAYPQPTIATQPVTTPLPTPTVTLPTPPPQAPQPTVATPTLAEPSTTPPGPVVHLPDSTPPQSTTQPENQPTLQKPKESDEK